MGIAGSAFDYAIENFIVGFGRLYITGTGETIDALWSTVRDIFNLTFIFGLVYIGFKMILDSSDSSARKMLVSLIGAALLVNFSLFITKFIVDFSNIAATQVYNAFETTGSGPLSITNGFMTIMGINSILSYEYTAGGSFAYVLGVLLIFCTLAYVFLAGAIMIIIRFVVLNIYMVFSPFMFLGWVFPALQSYSRDYWSGFLKQAFFAPAFIFMLYLSYMVASTFPVQRNLALMFRSDTANNASALTDVSSMIPYFAMVMVFLCASMVVAKKMGAHGSTMAVSVGKNISGRARGALGAAAGGATLGLAGRLGRNTAGRYGQSVASNNALKELAAQKGLRGWSARQQLRAGRAIADSSFDARNIAGAGKALGIGAGAKGGYKTKIEATAKRDTAFAESLGTLDEKDVRVAARTRERDEADMALRFAKKTGDVKQIKEAEDNLKKANETLEQEKRRRQIGGTFTDPEVNKAAIAKEDATIDALKNQLKAGWKQYMETENLKVKEALLAGLKDLEKAKKASEATRKAFTKSNTDGYAKVVDINNGWDKVQSYVMGRTLHESRESADAIRKKFTKETKKSKEDINTDSIVKAVTSSAKSDH